MMNLHYIYSKDLSALLHKQQELVDSYLKENPTAHQKTIAAFEWLEDYVQSIQEGRVSNFIQEYHNTKLLIIIDFEYLAGKDSSCETLGRIIKHILRNDGMVIIESFYSIDEINNILPHIFLPLVDLIKFNGKISSICNQENQKGRNEMENMFEQLFLKIKDLPTKSKKNNTFNIFKVLGIENKEVLACRLLGELMNPHGAHGLGEKPLQLFLQIIGDPDFTHEEDLLKNATVVLEERIDNDRRVDIVIYIKDFVIPIEVKIWADDQNKQLYDYYQYFKKLEYGKHNFRIYYLTPNGRKPSSFSTNGLQEEHYKCISFNEDISEWLGDLKELNCGATPNKERVDIILEQFREVIEDMCTQENNLQIIKEAINFKEGQFESNDSMEALLCILEANQGNQLWKAIRKEYLRKNLKTESKDYEITEISEEDYETIEIPEGKKGYCIFSIKKSGKNIAWICIETNLYIVAKSIKSDNLNGWNGNEGYYWRYLNPNDNAGTFNLKEPNLGILNNNASIDLEELLKQISD